MFLTANIYYLLFCARHCALGQGYCACLPGGAYGSVGQADPRPPLMPAGLGQEYKWRPPTLKYCKVIHQANNCSIKYVLFSYSDKYTFILTWRARFECKIFHSSYSCAQIWWHEKSFPPTETRRVSDAHMWTLQSPSAKCHARCNLLPPGPPLRE